LGLRLCPPSTPPATVARPAGLAPAGTILVS
jgi:hypothetical protein